MLLPPSVYRRIRKRALEKCEKMKDIRYQDFSLNDCVVFIENNRDQDPKLMYGRVKQITPQSILIQDDSDTLHRLRLSDRPTKADQILHAVIISPLSDTIGNDLDFLGHSIAIGDTIAFMEVPSQGFSTSFIIGEVFRIDSDGIMILVRSSVYQKYMRKPHEIVVLEKK